MDKKLYICAAIILIISIFGLLAYSNLEIYPDKRTIYPSSTAYYNNYLAMERWLKVSGYNVRSGNYFNPDTLDGIQENVIIVHSWMCDWDNMDKIIPWIEDGGFLVICLDNLTYNNNLVDFLLDFGIIVVRYSGVETNRENNKIHPAFDRNISFAINDDKINYIEDLSGLIRFAELPVGKGALTVTGRPYFMYNSRLKEEPNAKLAWRLTGARAEKDSGVLIVQTQQNTRLERSLFGAIMERGNLVPVIISALILIFTGFWMVIPVFGLVFADKQKTSRPIKDRFNAEIRFLKKYNALDYYLDAFECGRENESNFKNERSYKEIVNQYRRLINGTAKT